jgi:hypothetical protein
MDNPAGNDPEASVQEIVPTPPVACTVAVYAVPTTPPGRELVVIVSGGGAEMAIVSCCVAEAGPPCAPEESVTLTVNVELAAVVGVPEIAPEVLKDNPAGNDDPDAKVQLSVPAPPVAASVAV